MDGSGFHARAERLVDPRALESAVTALHRLRGDVSARRRLTSGQALTVFALIGICVAAPEHALLVAQAAGMLIFSALNTWRLFAAAASLSPPPPKPPFNGATPIYTILCPLYREARVAGRLVWSLTQLDYPRDKLDVKLILEEDDWETLEALSTMALPHGFEIVLVPPGGPRTKPKALNYALPSARGEFLTIYDAEDSPHPKQLRAALAAFAEGGESMGCVQAPLYADNPERSWIARQFAVEYAIHFGQTLPLLARLGTPPPLGGTSNHFRVSALTSSGGWDPFNVTEDADLGYRLARDGWRIGMIDPPTWEEAPVTLLAWMRQRSRWIKGHIQTWLVLMRNPLRTLRELGLGGFVAVQLTLGGGIVSALVHGPLLTWLAWTAWQDPHAVGWQYLALALFGYVVAAYGALAAAAVAGDLKLAGAALTMPLYWPLATLAAVRAIAELIVAPHYWAKTEHGLSVRAAPRWRRFRGVPARPPRKESIAAAARAPIDREARRA